MRRGSDDHRRAEVELRSKHGDRVRSAEDKCSGLGACDSYLNTRANLSAARLKEYAGNRRFPTIERMTNLL